ncbi:gamma-type small acid-soluble spore protein [Lysinibacillus louembei]|uniref:Small, acid-soluble spore protein gamma-type n=1 Tax=Lysinibacillus louembei TaxID=1470088 RepID=A0ABZ0RWF9_9BACI|nr:gamma-type small acid-soluble spore protein [Lysinibacillus louembei]WPK11288.1 gamma-type small acid-soluble spore protein [Lysinibacillus louembei]
MPKNNNQNFNPKTPNPMNEEFGAETDVNEVKQQVQKAETNKQQASGKFANNRNQNGTK